MITGIKLHELPVIKNRRNYNFINTLIKETALTSGKDTFSGYSSFQNFIAEMYSIYGDIDRLICNAVNDCNRIAEGSSKTAYSIPFIENFVLTVKKKKNPAFNYLTGNTLTKEEDILPGKNFGQTIAKAGSRINISKRVFGTELYGKDWYEYLSGKKQFTKDDGAHYLSRLRENTSLKDEIYEQYIEDILYLKERHFEIDNFSPANFLLDKKNERINIIDIHGYGLIEYSDLELADPLVDTNLLLKRYAAMSPPQRKETIEIIRDFIQRFRKIAAKSGIEPASDNYHKYRTKLQKIHERKDSVDYTNPNLSAYLYKW